MKDTEDSGPPGHTHTTQLCEWIHSLSLEQVPIEVQVRAKHLILDGIACALVGAHLPWSEIACKTILGMESAGPCTIIGYEKSLGPLAAALLNSTFIQGFELDDYHDSAPLHSNSIILPALIATAQHRHLDKFSVNTPLSGASFLLSAIVGYEIGPRVGLALNGGNMLTQGWHTGAVFGPSASAAAVCKALRLPVDLIEDALGTACTQACGLMSAQFESMVKRMQHGFAARNGLFAAMMTAGGYTGIKNVYERSYGGFLATFAQGSGREPAYQVDKLTESLGKTWETKNIKIKPYAAMAGTHCTVDCIAALQKLRPLTENHSKIHRVRVEMGHAAFTKGGWTPRRPIKVIGAQMSVAYIAAVQFLDGEVTPTQFRQDQLDSDDRWDLVSKITCEHNRDYDKSTPWKQRVTISFEDGHEIAHEEDAPMGVQSPLSNADIVSKWRQITRNVIGEERGAQIERMVLRLENVDDVGKLVELLAGVTKNPIA